MMGNNQGPALPCSAPASLQDHTCRLSEGSIHSYWKGKKPLQVIPGIILKMPNMITRTAENVMKCLCTFPFTKLENAPMPASDGSVPSEKASMVKAPAVKLPLPKT